MNRRGYIHWLIPVTLIVLIAGIITAKLMQTTIMTLAVVIAIGGMTGHMVRLRTKISMFSIHVTIIAFIIGLGYSQGFMKPFWVFSLFYISLAVVFYGGKALRG